MLYKYAERNDDLEKLSQEFGKLGLMTLIFPLNLTPATGDEQTGTPLRSQHLSAEQRKLDKDMQRVRILSSAREEYSTNNRDNRTRS